MADIFPTDYISYLDGRRSKFPNEIDQIPEKFNLPAHLKDSLKRFQELFLKETLTPQEQIEFNELQNTLQPFLDDPETRNYLGDILVNMQKFFKEDVEPYVDNMKQDVLNYTNNKKQEIEQYTENKKQEFQVEVDKFTFRGEWQPNTQYYQKNIVIYGGEAYIAKTNNINIVPTNTNYWAKIAAKGEKGDPSLNINYKGEYNNNTIYVEGDAVTFGGLWYYAKKTTQGNPPTNEEYWELHSNQAIISNTQPFDSRITLWIDTSRNVVRFYNSATGKWEVAGSDRIVNNDGSASYGYDDIKEIENNVNNLKEQFDKAQYTPEIYNSARVFSMGQGYDKEGNAVDYSGSIVNGQINDIRIEGKTVTNILGDLGDFEDLNKWSKDLNYGTLDNTKKVFGNYSLRQIRDNQNGYLYKDDIPLKKDKYYFLSLYRFVEVPSSDSVIIALYDNNTFDNMQIITASFVNTDNLNVWERIGYKFQSTKDICRFMIGGGGLSTTTYNIDGLMLIEITEEEYNNLSVEELMQKYQYINDTKSTVSTVRLKSVGKNLLRNGNGENGTMYWNPLTSDSFIFNGEYFEKVEGKGITVYSDYFKLPIGQFRLSSIGQSLIGPSFQIDLFDENGVSLGKYYHGPNLTSAGVTISLTESKNVRIRLTTGSTSNHFIIKQIQLERNTVATEYESYKESNLYVTAKDEEGNILELHSLPNGVKDEIRVSGNKAKHIQRIKKYVLQARDISDIRTGMSNIDYVVITLNLDIPSLPIGDVVNIPTMSKGWSTTDNMDNVENIGKWGPWSTANKQIAIAFAKGTTLEQIKSTLIGTELIYQLAEPIEVPIEAFGNLQSYENGTVYVDTIIPRIDFYDINGIAVDVPIGTIDTLYKVDKETGYLYSLDISQAEISQDRLSFIHPDLVEGDLVDWDYVPDVESTNPAISMKLPTNLKASVTSALQGVQELSNKTKKLDTRVIANRRDIEKLDTRVTTNRRDIDWNNFILGILENKFNTHLSENSGKHITESGENPHGSYIKFDDGTMICRGETTVTAQINTEWGSIYYYTIGRLTFPHAFVGKPYVIPVNLGNRSVILDTYGVRQTDTGNISIYRPVADDQEYDYSVGYVAIGRWK